MKSLKTLFVVASLSVSSFAIAEGGADRVFTLMAQTQERSVKAYQVAQKTKADAEASDTEPKSVTRSHC